MNSRTRVSTALGAIATSATLVVGLAACGSSSKSAASSTAASSSDSSSSARAGGRYSDPKVQACLKAAGISIPANRTRPSGSARPSRPSGSDFPTNYPSGARPSGGFGNSAEQQKIQAALKACGITLPSFSPRRTAQPSGAAPSSS